MIANSLKSPCFCGMTLTSHVGPAEAPGAAVHPRMAHVGAGLRSVPGNRVSCTSRGGRRSPQRVLQLYGALQRLGFPRGGAACHHGNGKIMNQLRICVCVDVQIVSFHIFISMLFLSLSLFSSTCDCAHVQRTLHTLRTTTGEPWRRSAARQLPVKPRPVGSQSLRGRQKRRGLAGGGASSRAAARRRNLPLCHERN